MSEPNRGPAPAATRADVAKLHEFEHWPARWIWPLFAGMLALQAVAVALPTRDWPLLFVIWPVLGAIMFVFTLSFHDASHGRMHPIGWMNDAFGHAVGTFGFTPLNVYRYAHARHHAQLARQGDPELWPYNSPTVPRAFRVAAAFAEIIFGFLYTPLLFLRSVLVGQTTAEERRKIIRGYAGCILFWGAVLAGAYYFDMWRALIVGTLIPLVISGMMQTLNKFEQHLGLHGHTVLGLTRTVVDESRSAEIVSAAMLYNDYHGTHHRYAKIPYYHLPSATPFALSGAREHAPVFPSIVSASLDMLRCLANPKVGPQWISREAPANTAANDASLANSTVTIATDETVVDQPANAPSAPHTVVNPVYTGQYTTH